MPTKAQLRVKKVLKPAEGTEAVTPTKARAPPKKQRGQRSLAEIKQDNWEVLSSGILEPFLIEIAKRTDKVITDVNSFVKDNVLPAGLQKQLREYFIKLHACIMDQKPEKVADIKDLEKKAKLATNIKETLFVFQQASKPK